MSEDASTAQAGSENAAESGNDTSQKTEFTPITSQEEMDRIVTARLSRQAAKFADYGDLKAKAAKFDEQAEANKSDLQKALDRAEAAEKQLGAVEADKTRLAVIAKHQIPAELQDLVHGATEDELEKTAERVAGLSKAASQRGPYSPTEGTQPQHRSNVSSDWLRDEFTNH